MKSSEKKYHGVTRIDDQLFLRRAKAFNDSLYETVLIQLERFPKYSALADQIRAMLRAGHLDFQAGDVLSQEFGMAVEDLIAYCMGVRCSQIDWLNRPENYSGDARSGKSVPRLYLLSSNK